MSKIDIIKELDTLDVLEEFINCGMWLSKYIKDFKNDSALDKAYGIWEKNMALRHWIRKNTLKAQYPLWIGKAVRASQKMPPKGGVVVFTKEKNAYTWSSSKKFAVSNTQVESDKIKGSYLIRVYTTKDEVIFDIYGMSKFRIDDAEVNELIEAGISAKRVKFLKDVLDELTKDAFKEIVICNDVVNRGVISAVMPKGGESDGNWRFR